MFYVPLYFEAIRARPLLVFWLATLTQAVLWLAVPILFYAAPPGDLAQVLAIGHQFQFDSDVGPPLAFWLAEIAFRAGGPVGVYALSQVCVIATYWCVFRLGSAIVGPAQAVVAVLLMVGISSFSVPTPDFGPAVLTMALWAFVLLHYWRAVAEGQRRSWYLLGVGAALILLTSEAALILLGTLVLFTVFAPRGRAALERIDPWIVAAVLVCALFVHLLWLEGASDSLTPTIARLREAGIAETNMISWLRLVSALVLAHAGLAILVVLAGGWPRVSAGPLPALKRGAVDDFARRFVKVVALLPALLSTIIAVVLGRPLPIGGIAPLLVLSALAVVLIAGDAIELYHQRILGIAWTGLLLVPAIMVPAVMVLLPWTLGSEVSVAQPAAAMGRFFADAFQSRTGRPLAVVSGEIGPAAIIALGAPSRPSVYFEDDPQRSPSVTPADIRKKGAIVVWLAADTNPAPPPEIKAYFPDIVPEVPQVFERRVQGRMPPLRVGWAVIRPAPVTAQAAAR
ncbi:MAG TPA: glycosyltransferase family 39 protein [Xanthobacteraceae bacterium]|nr:glycosyltransferase family 39 protein [Xanthobacteraceae bacterium]